MRHAIALSILLAASTHAQSFRPEIPRFWNDHDVESFELPLAQRDRSPRHMSSADYYALTPRPIYRTYPVYAPGRAPAGYYESLKAKEPEILFDPAKLSTKQDWIAAGKFVFESEPLLFPFKEDNIQFTSLRPGKDGILPGFLPGNRIVIRKKGVLEAGINSCAGCHTRIMPDGSQLQGAQGIVDPLPTEEDLQRARNLTPERIRRRQETFWILYGAPWIQPKEQFIAFYTKEVLYRLDAADRPGVFARQGTSQTHRPHVPSLIGIQDIKYLDATGLVRHRSIGDLARYAITNQGLDTMAFYGDFQPSTQTTPFSSEPGTRYSDEQLYALALYLYSLQPPPNPNKFDARARRGQQIFQQQGCAGCHTPPLYTNNKITPALGFKIPADLRQTDNILDTSVATDPTLTLKTRRGTGFYKVPSLRGVWYRNAFGHTGAADSLEEWLDPARLQPNYVPKGFHLDSGPIQGHPFGLNLKPADKQALIAFLKTL